MNHVPTSRTGGEYADLRRNGDVFSTIAGYGSPIVEYGVDGRLLRMEPSDMLAHEIVGHALPAMGFADTGNAIENENRVRAETGGGRRKPDPRHCELDCPRRL